MAITVKGRDGKADASVTPTGTQSLTLFGPPMSGNPQTKGIYLVSVAGATGTYRHLEDVQTPGTASPSSFTYAGF